MFHDYFPFLWLNITILFCNFCFIFIKDFCVLVNLGMTPNAKGCIEIMYQYRPFIHTEGQRSFLSSVGDQSISLQMVIWPTLTNLKTGVYALITGVQLTLWPQRKYGPTIISVYYTIVYTFYCYTCMVTCCKNHTDTSFKIYLFVTVVIITHAALCFNHLAYFMLFYNMVCLSMNLSMVFMPLMLF